MGRTSWEENVLDGFGLLDLVCSTVTNENRLASPFDDDVLAFGDGRDVDFDLGLREDVGGGGHVDQEICDTVLDSRSRSAV